MRILAIRGCNLASLAGKFAIELEDGPLSRSGLFAITGPTGAGKSTLLDALCLALFDKTPRLDSRGGVPIGRPDETDELRVKANDVRSVLRRGTAAGYAEVDFVGRDGLRYRSRWSVRRARDRVDGRLQAQSLSLVDLDSGRDLSGTKSETLETIEQRLGLSFEQFRRSALLAQGDFAAFLRANSKERAELLERMTGTQIYGEISRAAFLRAKQEQQALTSLASTVEQHAVLDEGARAELEAAAVDAKQAVAVAQTQLTSTEATLAWYAKLAELCAGEESATGALANCQAAWKQSASWRAELEAVTRARLLRAEATAVDRARVELERVMALVQQLETQRATLTSAVVDTAALLEGADNRLTEARAELKTAQPAITAAIRLDGEVEAATRAVASADLDATEKATRLAQVTESRAQMAAELDEVSAAAAAAGAWLAEHASVEPLAAEWRRWSALLDRHATALVARDDAALRRAQLIDRDEACRGQLRQLSEAQTAARTAWTESHQAAARAEKLADEHPVDTIRRRTRQVGGRHAQLAILAHAAQAAAESAVAARDATERATQARADEARARDEIAKLERWWLRVDAQFGEAERALNQIKLAQHMSDLRADLVDGEPCPLCGAKDHPFAEHATINQYIEEQQQRLDDLQAERRQVDDDRVATHRRAEAAREAAERADVEANAATAAVARASAAWRGALEQLGELPLFGDPADVRAGQWANVELEACAAELARLAEQEEQAVALREAAIAARSVATLRRDDYDAAVEAFRGAEREAQQVSTQLANADRDLARAKKDLASYLAELAPAFASVTDWQAELTADAAAFRARWQGVVVGFHEQTATRQRCDERARELRAKLDETAKQAQAYERDHEAVAARLCAARDALAKLAAERAQLFGGRPIAEVLAGFDAAIASAEAAQREQAAAYQRAAEQLATNGAQLASQRGEIEERQSQLAAATQTFAAALATSQMDEATARAHLAVTDTWLAEHERRREQLSTELEQQTAIASERRTQREQHETQDPPALSQGDAELAEQAARAAVDAARETLVELTSRLRSDDDARAAHARLADRIAEQRRREATYKALSDLIGSSDGGKFREFAQSLTLEALLAAANDHLAELAARYRLLRVPDHHLELQVVDRSMGDEVRSVNSLSGGESFLVSLALALGLSSLSAKDIRVESLLIDEGFGTLDQHTLETALAVLDSLQASGRKVGLISHVPGLAERIGARITVSPQGGGRSTVRVEA